MTCFWDSIQSQMTIKDYNKLGLNNRVSHIDLIEGFKKNSILTYGVRWQGERITSKSMNENREHILSFDSTTINRGYDCSTCDPFLLLISELFEVDISHDYNGNIILYKSILNNTGRCFKFKSDRGHIEKI